MRNLTHKHPILLAAALAAVMLLISLACTIGGLTINSSSATVDITLTQEQVNLLLKNTEVNVSDNPDRLLDKITAVEFHDGFVRVLGTITDTKGITANGSYDISISAANNALVVKISSVNIPGMTLDDPRVAKANQQFLDGLSKSVSTSHGEVLYKQVSITAAHGLKLTVQVVFQNK